MRERRIWERLITSRNLLRVLHPRLEETLAYVLCIFQNLGLCLPQQTRTLNSACQFVSKNPNGERKGKACSENRQKLPCGLLEQGSHSAQVYQVLFPQPRMSGYSVSLHTPSHSWVRGTVSGTLYVLVPVGFTNALVKNASLPFLNQRLRVV